MRLSWLQIIWSMLGAILLLIFRNAILAFNGEGTSIPFLLGSLLSVLSSFCILLLISVFLLPTLKKNYKGKNKKNKIGSLSVFAKKYRFIAAVFALAIVFLLHFLAYHYEAVFSRYPSSSMFYYLAELKHLKSSLFEYAHPIVIFFEVLTAMVFVLKTPRWILRTLKNSELSRNYSVAIVVLAISLITFLHWKGDLMGSQVYQGAQNPIFSAFRSWISSNKGYLAQNVKLTPQQVRKFQRMLGQKYPAGGVVEKYPLCSYVLRGTEAATEKSVIFLVLESIGTNEMASKYDGVVSMPNLQRIASENLSFKNFFAAGTKSGQAMPALFAGLPAQTIQNILWMNPPMRMEGFPSQLQKRSYTTSYFHGGDLSFENQQFFLKSVGFQQIYGFTGIEESSVYGWGYDDKYVLKKMKQWIQRQRQKSSDPFFATMFSLSTHDPFILPSSWKSQFMKVEKPNVFDLDSWSKLLSEGGRERRIRMTMEANRFLDHQLGDFYKWYLTEEKPKGTLLVITGDHSSYLNKSVEPFERFRMPFIIAGLDQVELQNFRKYENRLASAVDVPATLSHLLGVENHHCDQGVSLLTSGVEWPAKRIVFSVAGENLEHVYFRNQHGEVIFDRNQRTLKLIQFEPLKPMRSTNRQESSQLLEDVKHMITTLYPLNLYLLKNNAYFPKKTKNVDQRTKIKPTSRPIYVSHRGNLTGDNRQTENSWESIEAVVNSKFEWIELDIQMTKDDIPIVFHDEKIGNKYVFELKLEEIQKLSGNKQIPSLYEVLQKYGDKINFLIEAKPQPHIARWMAGARLISQYLKQLPDSTKVMVDSFSPRMAASIATQCERCEMAWDLPYKQPVTKQMIEFAVNIGMNWVFVEYSVVNEEAIQLAHENGIKLMAYTVNDSRVLSEWSSLLPDGIITDMESLVPIQR